MLPDTLSVAVRALTFVVLFQAMGAAIFAALFYKKLAFSMDAVNRLAVGSALFGVPLILIHLSLDAARMTGEMAGVMDVSMQTTAWTSASAVSHGMQTLGLVLIAIAMSRRRCNAVLGWIGVLCAAGGFLLVGHTSIHPLRVILAPLLVVHLLIVAFWFGSLLPLWIVTKRESAQTAHSVLHLFSTFATWLVPVLAIAGFAMMLLIASGIPPLKKPYGALIVAKVVGFAILMLLAALNKWCLAPAIASSNIKSRISLRRSMIAEFSLIVGVLSVTAVMTALFSPNE